MNGTMKIAMVLLVAALAAGCSDYDPTSKSGREETREELKDRGYIKLEAVGAPKDKADKDADAADAKRESDTVVPAEKK